MAKIKMTGFEDLEKYLVKHADKTAALTKRCVYAGAYAVADDVRKSAESVIMKDREHTARQTGELLSDGHFGVTHIKANASGAETAVGFDGYDSKGTPIPLIAAVLESGNSTNSQQATHFFSRATRSARPKAYSAMQKIVNKFMENNQGE